MAVEDMHNTTFEALVLGVPGKNLEFLTRQREGIG
jgi:hypothetical protein